MNARHQQALADRDELIDQVRTDLAGELHRLHQLVDQLEDLTDTRQSVGLGFMTPEARELADRQARLDRAAARGHLSHIDGIGMTWMNVGNIAGTGQVPAPATMPAVSVLADIAFTLQHHVRRLTPAAARAAAAAVPGSRGRLPAGLPTTDGTTSQLIGHLADLTGVYASRPGLQALLREVEHLTRAASDVVDGPARTNHPEPCPWCGNTTLVVHHRVEGTHAQVIRCEGHHPCECDWEFCDCHRNPRRNRHEWVNSGGATHTWTELANLQTTRKEIERMETRAHDTLEQIRDLHQPIPIHPWADTDLAQDKRGLRTLPGTCTDSNHEGDWVEPEDGDGLICMACAPLFHACRSCTDIAGELVEWPCRTGQLIEQHDNPDADSEGPARS